MVDTMSPKQQIEELTLAARLGESDNVASLLRRGADVNGLDSEGETALIGASTWGRDNVVKVLLAAGANPNLKDAAGSTPLIGAVSLFGNQDLVMALLSAGAAVTGTDENGEGVYIWALRGGHKDLAEFLKKRGAVVPDSIF